LSVSTAKPGESPHRRRALGCQLALLAILTMAAALRIAASQDNFWLDEIWSWEFANQAKSLWQIATQIRHDNNHILNTWIIHCFPPETDWRIYRLPAVVAGIGTVVLAGVSGWKRSRCEGITALLLTASSFVLIQYSSEARGYAYLLFFTMLCVWLMERVSTARSRWGECLVGVGASLGMLAHLSFVTAWMGLVAWSVVVVCRREQTWGSRVWPLLRLHALPLATLLWLAAYNGGMMIGGGDRQGLGRVIVQAGSLAIGGPDSGWGALLVFLVAAAASVAGLVVMLRSGELSACFWGATALTMGVVLVVTGHEVIYVRYFLIELLGVLALVSRVLAGVWKAGTLGRLVYVAMVALIITGNALHIVPFLEYGRGGYETAVATLIAESSSPVIGIGSDHDFRNTKVLAYYLGRRQDSRKVNYFPNRNWPPSGPDWVILHSFQQPPNAPPELNDTAGNKYQKRHEYRYSGLSGWNWILYQRES